MLKSLCTSSSQEEEEKEEEEQAKMKQSVGCDKDVALEEMISSTASEVQKEARAKALDKQEKLCKVSEALAVLASASVRIKMIQVLAYKSLQTLYPSSLVIFSEFIFLFLLFCAVCE